MALWLKTPLFKIKIVSKYTAIKYWQMLWSFYLIIHLPEMRQKRYEDKKILLVTLAHLGVCVGGFWDIKMTTEIILGGHFFLFIFILSSTSETYGQSALLRTWITTLFFISAISSAFAPNALVWLLYYSLYTTRSHFFFC